MTHLAETYHAKIWMRDDAPFAAYDISDTAVADLDLRRSPHWLEIQFDQADASVETPISPMILRASSTSSANPLAAMDCKPAASRLCASSELSRDSMVLSPAPMTALWSSVDCSSFEGYARRASECVPNTSVSSACPKMVFRRRNSFAATERRSSSILVGQPSPARCAAGFRRRSLNGWRPSSGNRAEYFSAFARAALNFLRAGPSQAGQTHPQIVARYGEHANTALYEGDDAEREGFERPYQPKPVEWPNLKLYCPFTVRRL